MLLDGWINIGNAAFFYSFSTLFCGVFDLHMSYDAESLSDCDSIAALHPPGTPAFADVYHIFFHLLPYTDATF